MYNELETATTLLIIIINSDKYNLIDTFTINYFEATDIDVFHI